MPAIDVTRILALDTSTKAQALALVDGGVPVARRLSRVPANHSATLLANIDDMLAQAEWTVGDVDAVAVGLGPGTFTGLRVGLATAKALARSSGAKLIGVSSLAAIANPVTSLFDGVVIAVGDARRGEVYVGEYQRHENGLACLVEPHATRPETLAERCRSAEHPIVLVGSGLRAHEVLTKLQSPNVTVLPPPWDGPSSVSIAFLGRAAIEARGGDDIAGLEPNYIRASDAELNFGPPDTTDSVLK